jgi:putative transposase
VKTTEVGGAERGFDNGKKVKGRKRHVSNSNFGFARSLRLPIDTDLATVGLP